MNSGKTICGSHVLTSGKTLFLMKMIWIFIVRLTLSVYLLAVIVCLACQFGCQILENYDFMMFLIKISEGETATVCWLKITLSSAQHSAIVSKI